MKRSLSNQRIAIVSGLRTPFSRQWTQLKSLSTIEMGTLLVNGLLDRTEIPKDLIDQVVFGQVIPTTYAPNIAREIVLASELSASTDGFSVSRACATSFQALVSASESIKAGQLQTAIVGGADTSSILPITFSQAFARRLIASQKSRSIKEKLSAFKGFSLKELLPIPPAVAEFSTGLTMGDTAEQMAKHHQISRSEQDNYAHHSHKKAASAWSNGNISSEVLPIYAKPYNELVSTDNNIRANSTIDDYKRLKPVFDRQFGSVTAGNSSPLTDGAAALLIMSEIRARELGMPILGYIRSYAFSASPVEIDMLAGPAYSTPIALSRAGMTLQDMDLVEIHEAFAAQVLSVFKMWDSKKFAQEKLNQTNAIGSVDESRINVLGGSLAYGHPFAATGSRMILQLLNELNRRGGGLGLATACAAGGLGVSVVLEACDD